MYNICVHCIEFELCVAEKKKGRTERKMDKVVKLSLKVIVDGE